MRSSVGVKLTILALFVLSVFLASCTETADNDASGTLVTISLLQGLSAAGDQQDPLFSDICNNESGVLYPDGCVILADQAAVAMIARGKSLTSPFATREGPYQDVVFDRYRVTYIRADGRNTPGVDVPYPFDGAMNLYVPINEEGEATFIVVREQAKLELPLLNLAGNGGAIVLSTIAQIDFYGKDVAGHPMTVRGLLNITFADYAN